VTFELVEGSDSN